MPVIAFLCMPWLVCFTGRLASTKRMSSHRRGLVAAMRYLMRLCMHCQCIHGRGPTSLKCEANSWTLERLVDACCGGRLKRLSDPLNLNTVLALSNNLVVKFGTSVKEEEANITRLVRSTVDPKIIYVPRVFAFYCRDGIGYMISERIHGTHFDDRARLPDEVVWKLAAALQHLALHSSTHCKWLGQTLNPSVSEFPLPPLFHQTDFPEACKDVDKLSGWVNKRLFTSIGDRHVRFSEKDGPVLCHLDLAPRQLVLSSTGTLCILDWVSASYLPQSFEFAALFLQDRELYGQIAALLRPNRDTVESICNAHYNTLRYAV